MDERAKAWAALTDEERAFYDRRSQEYEAEAEKVLSASIEAHKGRKNELVARTTQDENDDLVSAIEVWRSGACVGHVICPEVGRDTMLNAALVAVPGFGADEVTLIVETHFATTPINPKTGKEWGEGEMQNACDNEGACDLGVTTDALHLIRRRRTGEQLVATVPYHVHKTGRTVAWTPVPEGMAQFSGSGPDTPLNRYEGVIAEALDEIFALPDLQELAISTGATPEATGMSLDQMRTHTDCDVVKILLERGYAVLFYPQNAEAAEIFQESLGRYADVEMTSGGSTDDANSDGGTREHATPS